MGDTISIEQLNKLKRDFKTYLQDARPVGSIRSISTIVSDAFFALNNDVGIDFWASLVDEESLRIARDKIRDFLLNVTESDHSEERANQYLNSLRILKQYLDDNHPNLASDWSGKAISNVNLKSDFQRWMKKRKKLDGDPYSPNTINTYTSALKSSTSKLHLEDAVYSDIFFYTSLADFEIARKLIEASPNFKEIDIAAKNTAYSQGLKLYKNFLMELSEPSTWIFQGNPKYYDVIGFVENLEILTWAVNQYRNQIKKGDRAYIWVSGSDGGIVASGTILTDPKMHSTNLDDPYSRGESLKSGPYLAVDIQIDRKFTQSVVSRSVLLADERTKKLEILTYPGQTNFQVTTDQEAVIESIIAGSYQREPALATTETEVVASRQYWLYAPGEQARFWDEFYDKGIIGLGSDELGSLSKFSSNAEIKAAMKNEYGEDRSYINDGLALWEFANTIQVDDVIIVKKGNSKVLGRGIVVSDYIFDGTRQEYKHIRKVKWTDKGVWEHPGQAVQKALTNITIYNEYVSQLEALFPIERGDGDLEYTDYSEMDFLDEVYIDPERYSTLKGLLLRKKNIILQGAPGVGKTFAAQRLAFSIMGKKDTSRVKVIQFHQSYSYEDFVMGYRPDGSAFRLAEGPFYKFCKAAEKDGERPYFFIIDEINRGNLSKIFGELLMLIENDKRGEQNSLRLLYKDEQFFVPPNVHIIGMMNTADRSLAMIDYALRRRFAFFDIEPAFSSDGFKTRQASIQNRKYDKLISTIESLNNAIAEDSSLGAGFRIGHSYFCTTDVVDDRWLSSVIEYELIPLLLEYWFDEPSKVESWSNQLRKF